MPSIEYIEALQRVIVELHGCSSEHVETVQISETFVDAVWQGSVEVFEVFGHSRARQCYAWMQPDRQNDKRIRFFALLGSSVIKTALDAIKVAQLAESAALINEFSKLQEHKNKPPGV